MENTISIKILEEKLDFFRTMYDAVRIVDPVRKEVLECKDCRIEKTGTVCHDYWGQCGICNNCISVRAYQEQKYFMKIEQGTGPTMVVTALPVQNADLPLVIELLKDASGLIYMGSGVYDQGVPMEAALVEMNEAIVTDHLTRLYNRRFIDERLPVDSVRSVAENEPLSVLFLDMDNLKEINDTLGHVFGDRAIGMVADCIRKNIREGQDWAARYGGDEFVVCLNNTGRETAMSIAERIRQGVQGLSVSDCALQFPVTVTIGIRSSEGEQLTAEDFLNQADTLMKKAKHDGKNRVQGSGA